MAIALGFAFRPHFSLRYPLLHCVHKVRLCCALVTERVDELESRGIDDNSSECSIPSIGSDCLCVLSNGALSLFEIKDVGGGRKLSEWKKLSCEDLGISTSMIPRPTRVVLNGLKRKGFQVYLVGGCVRDLILKRTPKDFDIITSAELKEVMGIFSRCQIIGKRFPICHVHIDDSIVEVSSFSTRGKSARDFTLAYEKPINSDEKDYIRWRNCLHRDFTINGLMFDPYAKIVYDYIGGLEDIRKAKVQTVVPASLSLLDDSARILRAVRLAARLGFCLSRETAQMIKCLSCSVLGLDKARLLMEMNYMLAYGSAEASLRLLWRFGLLEILLPFQAAYFVRYGFKRRDKGYNMLLSLFSNLDKLLAPNRPCHSSLWVAILAFHKALSDEPRDPLVVAAFGLAVHNGGDILEALRIVRKISRPHDVSLKELLEPTDLDSKLLTDEVIQLAASVQGALINMTDDYFVSKAMSAYPKAPYSDLVFISLELYLLVGKIFECVRRGKEEDFVSKQGSRIDYELLALGSLQEVRHVFARVVFDTIYPVCLTQDNSGA